MDTPPVCLPLLSIAPQSVALTLIWLPFGGCRVSLLGIHVLFLIGEAPGGQSQSDEGDYIRGGEVIINARQELSLHDSV